MPAGAASRRFIFHSPVECGVGVGLINFALMKHSAAAVICARLTVLRRRAAAGTFSENCTPPPPQQKAIVSANASRLAYLQYT